MGDDHKNIVSVFLTANQRNWRKRWRLPFYLSFRLLFFLDKRTEQEKWTNGTEFSKQMVQIFLTVRTDPNVWTTFITGLPVPFAFQPKYTGIYLNGKHLKWPVLGPLFFKVQGLTAVWNTKGFVCRVEKFAARHIFAYVFYIFLKPHNCRIFWRSTVSKLAIFLISNAWTLSGNHFLPRHFFLNR